VETIKRQTRVAYGWSVVSQSVGAVLAYGLYAVRPLSMTWTAPTAFQWRFLLSTAVVLLLLLNWFCRSSWK